MTITDWVTAVATAATAVAVLVQICLQKAAADPHLRLEWSAVGDGIFRARILIFPGTQTMRFHMVTAKNGGIEEAVLGVGSSGMTIFNAPNPCPRSWMSLDLTIPPARISAEPHDLHLYVEPRNTSRAVVIALKTRIMCFPIKYKLELDPSRRNA